MRGQGELDVPLPMGSTDLVAAAKATVDSLRGQNVIQPWHELDCAIVIEAAEGVVASRGVAKSNMLGQLLAARARLPEPVIKESDDMVQFEAERELEWLAAHGYSSDVQDTAQRASI